MTIERFSFPTTIHFGPGARKLVAEHLKSQGVARPLIVTDRGIAPLPLLQQFVADLPGLDVAVYSDIWGNPVRSQVNLGVDAFKAHRADAVIGLPQWHRWHDLFELAHLVVAERPGVMLDDALPAALLPQWNARLTSDPVLLRRTPFGAIYRQRIAPQPISASAIRAAIAEGHDAVTAVGGLLPDSVLAYIERNGLYRAPSTR